MKRVLLSLALFGLLVLPLAVLGAEPAPKDVPEVDVLEVLDNIVDWLFTLLLIIAAIAIIVAAYYFVTAAGDPERVKTARQFVIYALVGVAVALAARGLVALVERIVAG